MDIFEQIEEEFKCKTSYTEEEILFFQQQQLEFLNEIDQVS